MLGQCWKFLHSDGAVPSTPKVWWRLCLPLLCQALGATSKHSFGCISQRMLIKWVIMGLWCWGTVRGAPRNWGAYPINPGQKLTNSSLTLNSKACSGGSWSCRAGSRVLVPHMRLMSTQRWSQQQEGFVHTLRSMFVWAYDQTHGAWTVPAVFQVGTKGVLMIKILRGNESNYRRSEIFCRGFSASFNLSQQNRLGF